MVFTRLISACVCMSAAHFSVRQTRKRFGEYMQSYDVRAHATQKFLTLVNPALEYMVPLRAGCPLCFFFVCVHCSLCLRLFCLHLFCLCVVWLAVCRCVPTDCDLRC
jgi:hypothetical protein